MFHRSVMKTRRCSKDDVLSIPKLMEKFPTEETAIALLESILWPNGPECPHCENKDAAKFWKVTASKTTGVRAGLRQCAVCKAKTRVTVGTIFEDSHIPLNKWLIAWYLLCGAKKSMSALQLQGAIGLGSYKSAWFMAHRIRHAMADPVLVRKLSGIVEADESWIGGKNTGKGSAGAKMNKTPVVAIVERGGRIRSIALDRITGNNLRKAIRENVEICSHLHTDHNPIYVGMQPKYDLSSVKHCAKEYSRGNVHVNTAECSFSLLKRAVVGSFHHIGKTHLPLYLSEADFKFNHRRDTDSERTIAGLRKVAGKRMLYKTPRRKVA